MATRTIQQDIADGIALLERANSRLRPAEMTGTEAKALMQAYARVQKLGGYGVAALSTRMGDTSAVAQVSGVSMGKARDAVATGATMQTSPDLEAAMQQGTVSLDQATEIARAEESAPGSARELLQVAQREAFHALRDKARKVKLEAEQHRDLAIRQHAARRARTHVDALGMVHIHLELQPHLAAPLVARAEAEAQRLARAAKAATKGEREREPFERSLADAYAQMLASGAGKGPSKRPELVILVSHSVAKRGWKDVPPGEMCKIPGLGPIAPQVAKEIAADAFLNGVFFDGTDLRHFKRWSRDISIEVRTALELGQPPAFDGIRCRDCGNHFRTEMDHVEPHVALGPASTTNLEPRCWPCHQAKTARDRQAGKTRPPPGKTRPQAGKTRPQAGKTRPPPGLRASGNT